MGASSLDGDNLEILLCHGDADADADAGGAAPRETVVWLMTGPSDLVFVDELLECGQPKPVKYPFTEVTKTNFTLTVDLRNVPRDTFEQKVSIDGVPYVTVLYKLVVTTNTARMIFSVKVKGKEMGSIEAKFDGAGEAICISIPF